MTTNTETPTQKTPLTDEIIQTVVKPFQDKLDEMGFASVVLLGEKEETEGSSLSGVSENFKDLDPNVVRGLVKVAYKFVGRWESLVFGNEDELEEACANN